MRHGKRRRKLSRNTAHRTALMRNLAKTLIKEEKIETTVAKAKELKKFADKLVTLAKKGDLASRRLVAREIQDKSILKKLFDTIAIKFTDRPGGYTRVVKTGKYRRGDGAETAIIAFIGSEQVRLEEKAKRIEQKKKSQPAGPKIT
jgi:large subunit ribosomal protein L17